MFGLLGSGGVAAQSSNVPGTEAWAPGRVLLAPRAGLSEQDLGRIVGAHGGHARQIGQSRLYIVQLPPGASEKAVAEKLAHHPQIKFAELDHRVQPNFAASDPYFGSEWHLAKIGAPSAWDIAQGSGVTIAILDSGIDATHPDLAAQIVPGWNFYDNNSNTVDVYGHGTVVAGTAAATNNNGIGVASLTGQSKIMPLRITDTAGWGYWSLVAQALTYAADHGARVANISFDGVAGSSTVRSAAQYMKNKGGLVVVGAGNQGTNESISATTTMIPVSATDSNDQITSWSSYGGYVALSAPGVGIYSTSNGGGYGAYSGTSVSSPVVAGTVALMMSANPRLANTQVESLLYSTAVDLGSAGRDIYYGYGRVNAAGAVQAAAGSTTTAVVDSQPPNVSISAPLASDTVSGLVPVNVSATDNVGVSKVELRANGASVATDTASPFAFSWNSAGVPNGMVTLVAYAYDASGNSTASAAVSVNVANVTSTAPLVVSIVKPEPGTVKNMVSVSTSATDGADSSAISQNLYIDGVLKASGTGSSLSYSWNTRKVPSGAHTIQVVARDAAGKSATSSVQVTN